MVNQIKSILLGRTTEDWHKTLTEAQVPAGPVWNMTELFRSDLGRERNLKMTIKSPDGREVDFVKSPLVGPQVSTSYPPRIGEHSREILRDILGLREDEIETLQNQGVVSKNRA